MRKDELSDNEQTLLSQACERLSFLIIGTGRCGTGYAAGLVTACGFPTGHEEVFGQMDRDMFHGVWLEIRPG